MRIANDASMSQNTTQTVVSILVREFKFKYSEYYTVVRPGLGDAPRLPTSRSHRLNRIAFSRFTSDFRWRNFAFNFGSVSNSGAAWSSAMESSVIEAMLGWSQRQEGTWLRLPTDFASLHSHFSSVIRIRWFAQIGMILPKYLHCWWELREESAHLHQWIHWKYKLR